MNVIITDDRISTIRGEGIIAREDEPALWPLISGLAALDEHDLASVQLFLKVARRTIAAADRRTERERIQRAEHEAALGRMRADIREMLNRPVAKVGAE